MNNKKAKDIMYPETATLLRSWHEYLKEHGEKETFKMIKKQNKY